MATIVGGIAVSHTPTIGFAHDAHKEQDPAWAPIFESFEPVKRWLREQQPDAIVYVYNGRVELWRGSIRFGLSVAAPFVWRCPSTLALTPFPQPAHRTGRADLP
ncbi:MAG TPA: hypothetical protein VJU59_49625, partial [Paraburkholderia sp.]|nr:hypothetical protein [Paraburkholderia sp.]